MAKQAAVTIAGVMLSILCSSASGQGTFELKYQEAGTWPHPLISGVEQHLWAERRRPAAVKALPEGVSDGVSYCVGRVAGRQVAFVLSHSKPPKLFVDTDGDGDLAEEKALEGAEVKRGSWFTPERLHSFGTFTLQAPEGQGGPAQCQARLQDYGGASRFLVLSPAGFSYGKVELAGVSYRVAVVDANLDGRYDSVFSPARERDCDRLAIDLNDDRTFDTRGPESQEFLPLPRLLPLKDAYYTVEVGADGSTIRFEKAEPRRGTLDVGSPFAAVSLASDCGAYRLTGEDGKWSLPVGAYACARAILSRTDEKGAKWTLEADREFGKLAQFEIAEGETLSLKAGPPLALKAGVEQRGRAVSIDFAAFGQAGEKYSPAAGRNGETGPPPRLRIFGESDNVLAKGSFEFG